MERLSVTFGDLVAVDDVSMELEPGRIHALVGQNGAGKTTLARAVLGLVRPAAGTVHVFGHRLPPGDVAAARASGIDMVHQSFTLPPSFTVGEALELFDPGPRPAYRRSGLARRWAAELAGSGVDVSPNARIRDLPIESLQAIEILRALSGRIRLLVLDEPTALLPPQAIERLFARLRAIRDEGITVVIVLHKVQEVLAVADTVSVMRRGRLVLATAPTASMTVHRLSDLIIGTDDPTAASREALRIDSAEVQIAPAPRPGSPVLALAGVSTASRASDAPLRDISLTVAGGEIVGIAGVEGNGQRALVRLITGLERPTEGRVEIDGEDVTHDATHERRRLGMRTIPFDRNAEGISSTSRIWENVAVREILTIPQGSPLLSLGALRSRAHAALEHWNVVFTSVDQRAGELSGGNIQRLIFARELGGPLRLMVAAQPTRGLDVVATSFVHATLRGLRDAGAAILLVSSDLEELFALSDRLVVVYGGANVATFTSPYSVAAVGAAMVGGVA